MSKLNDALRDQKKQTEQYNQKISGILGITINGAKAVEVAGRKSYVYVRLRNSQSELIQAFNNRVAPSYNLPVLVERQGNRYVVLDVDTTRYDNNWASYSPYLPRHGNTHSFDIESGGGGDIVWVYPRQFMPLLAFPSGSVGSPNVIVSPYTLKKENGTWMYVGNTGTASFTPYNPVGSGSVMGLIVLNTDTGNPYLLINSGSVFFGITGSSQVYPYIPILTNPLHIPIAAVRLVSGTSRLTWDNIYDVRQFVHGQPSGSAGSSPANPPISGSVVIQDEGAIQGSALSLNFVGDPVSVSVVGGVATVTVTATASGSSSGGATFTGSANSIVVTDASGNLNTPDWLKWGTNVGKFVDFGADIVGREANAGRMGYNAFGSGHLDIVGAGTGTGSRVVHLYDNVIVDVDLSVQGNASATSMNLPSGTAYNTGGLPHSHLYIPIDGWVEASETWNRTGNHAFNIGSNVTGTYGIGTKIRYDEGGGYEYGVVGISSLTGSVTFINLVSNTNYSMAGSPATKHISRIEKPDGFPQQFDWTPVHSRSTTNYVNFPTVTFAKWAMKGTRVAFREQHQIAAIPSGSGNQKFTLPITPNSTADISRNTGNGMQLNSAYGLLVFIAEGEGCRVFKYDGTAEAIASSFYFINGEYEL